MEITCSTESALIEFDAPLPVTVRISGCDPAVERMQDGQTPHGAAARSALRQTTARAICRASVRFPSPASPASKIACGSLRREKAPESAVFSAALPAKSPNCI